MEKVLFTEEQRFTQTWIAILLYGMLVLNAGIFGYGLYKQIALGEAWGNTPMSDTALITVFLVVLIVFAGLLILFHRAVLITTITTEAIKVKFPPFFFSEKSFRAPEIKAAEVRKYRPILEYGGWGVRVGVRKGKAYNVKGHWGIQLYLKNSKKILIGTQKKDQATWAIQKMLKPEL